MLKWYRTNVMPAHTNGAKNSANGLKPLLPILCLKEKKPGFSILLPRLLQEDTGPFFKKIVLSCFSPSLPSSKSHMGESLLTKREEVTRFPWACQYIGGFLRCGWYAGPTRNRVMTHQVDACPQFKKHWPIVDICCANTSSMMREVRWSSERHARIPQLYRWQMKHGMMSSKKTLIVKRIGYIYLKDVYPTLPLFSHHI